MLCSGSTNRLATETKIWYPGFETISFPVKIIKGYLETNRVLFVTSELNIVYLFLVLIIVVSIIKKQYFMTFISGTVIYTVITQRLAMNSLLTAVQRTIDNQNKSEIPNYFSLKENLYPLILYTLILCTIATVVFLNV